jgi:HPt (histidine-containing phosphotransfer) domain-containing protein
MKYLQKFDQAFHYYPNETVMIVIGMFDTELEERLATISKNIAEKDFAKLKFNAHSLKGTIAVYGINEPVEFARKLEEMAGKQESENLEAIFNDLKVASKDLLIELREYKEILASR